MSRYFVEARIAPCSESPALAVRHALPIVDDVDGEVWSESFASDAFLVGGSGATITRGHDGPTVGHVVCVVPRGAWFYADAVIEADDPDVVREGQSVSIDAKTIRRDDDELAHVRRHRLAKLDAIALLAPGEVPVYQHASITRVREAPLRRVGIDGDVVTTEGTIVREGCGVVLGVR